MAIPSIQFPKRKKRFPSLKFPQYNQERPGQKMLILEGKWARVESWVNWDPPPLLKYTYSFLWHPDSLDFSETTCSYCAHPPGIPRQPSVFLYAHRESFQTGLDTKLLRLEDSLEELLDSGFCWWLPWTLGQNVVDSCLDIVGDLVFVVAAALFLQLSICLSTSFIEFCSQKMMPMGLMLPSHTGIKGFLGELWFSWSSILPVG